MNRSDLMLLKKSFDNKKRYTQYIGDDGPLYDVLTEQEIRELLDSKKAVDVSMDILKKMIIYLSRKDIAYNGISLCPSFSVFVDSDFVSEEGCVKNKKAILGDYVGISFSNGYYYFGRQQSKVFPVDALDNSDCIIYASFSDFVVGLNECGLELAGVSDFDTIRDLIVRDKKPVGRIRVSFSKNKTYRKGN